MNGSVFANLLMAEGSQKFMKGNYVFFKYMNDELAEMRPFRGRILLLSCIHVWVSSRAPSVEYETSNEGVTPEFFFSPLRGRAAAQRPLKRQGKRREKKWHRKV